MGTTEGARSALARVGGQVALDPDIGGSADAEFNYVIAYRFGEGDKHLACYMYGNTQVFYGDSSDALSFLEYVRTQAPDKAWAVIPVGA